MKKLFVAALAAGLFLGIAFFNQGFAGEPKRGGTLTVAIGKDLTTMNPLVRSFSTDRVIRDLMYESLLTLDLKGDIRPNLAESWELSQDGKLYTFHLRKGVKFHHGQEMTSEDVKFAVDYSMDPKNGAYGLSRLTGVEKVEATGRYAIKIQLKQVSPTFLAFLTDIGAFSAVPKESVQPGVDKLKAYPPGTGPFRFLEWKPGQRIAFERFEDYWGQRAFVDRLILRPIPDATVRFTGLRSGDLDIVERSPYEWVKEVAEGKITGIRAEKAPSAGFRRLYFNVADPPFNNKTLRQAVAHAMNKPEILNAAYFGFGEPTDQKYPKGHAWYIEGVPTPGYDLVKARALLKQSGYKGQTIPIMVRQGGDQETEATVLQAQLKKIGVDVKLQVLEYGAYAERQRKGDFAFMFYGAGFDPDPALAYQPELTCEDPRKRSSNVAAYCDKEVEALLGKAEVELNAEKRRALFKQILTKVNEDLPYVPVGFTPRFYTVRDHVRGFTTDHEGHLRFFGGGVNYAWLEKQ